MPTTDGYVGGSLIPVPAGQEKERFTDPMVEALLALSAHYLKVALDAKLQKLTGTSHDAVPPGREHRHTFDPLNARGIEVRIRNPSLFVFWDGKSSWGEQTTLLATRTREIQMVYVFSELPAKAEMDRRYGLFNAIDQTMFQMGVHQVRSDFALNNLTALGTWVNSTLAPSNQLSWEWMGGFPGRFGIDEGPRAERRFAKKSGRDFPALKGSWVVEERVSLESPSIPADLNSDIAATIHGSDGETTETVPFFNRVLTAPDGSEQL